MKVQLTQINYTVRIVAMLFLLLEYIQSVTECRDSFVPLLKLEIAVAKMSIDFAQIHCDNVGVGLKCQDDLDVVSGCSIVLTLAFLAMCH